MADDRGTVASKLADDFSVSRHEVTFFHAGNINKVCALGAVDVALERLFQVWCCFTDFHGLLPACNFLTPLWTNADKDSFAHTVSPLSDKQR